MIVYAVPVRPGTSRIFFATITSLKSPLFKLLALKPTFLDHITRMSVLSGDNVFLHAQERELRRSDFSYTLFCPVALLDPLTPSSTLHPLLSLSQLPEFFAISLMCSSMSSPSSPLPMLFFLCPVATYRLPAPLVPLPLIPPPSPL